MSVATPSRPPNRKLARLGAAASNPFLAYGAVLVLQMKILWKIWEYKDLTPGDTAGYFLDAVSWTHGLHDDIVWSPLYTNFLGTALAIFKGHVYTAEMVQRILIVLCAAALVLALTRALLGPAIGLLVTLWWVIVPVNFNVLYEVHLFGVLPILAAAVILAKWPGRRALGAGLGILVATMLLLRNELLIATIVFAAAVIVYEIRERRVRAVPAGVYLRAYAIPLVIVALLAGGLYWRSFDQGHQVKEVLRAKTGLNVCQAYAFNYQQRHPTKFTGSAFTECQPLMRQVFGHPEPSFTQAASEDPKAMAAYVLWNGRLLLSGVQVALFNATSTGDQPDYPLVQTHRAYALVLSIALLVLLVGGVLTIRREPRSRRRDWLARGGGWILVFLGAASLTTIVVALTERPRPEYMYGMTIVVMMLAGACLTALLRRFNATRFAAPAAVALALVAILAVPPYYQNAPRPLHDAIARMQPVRRRLQQPGSVLIAAQYNFETCAYLAETHIRECASPSWSALQAQLAGGSPIQAVLKQSKATVIYAESLLLSDPAIARLAATPARYGWRQVAGGVGQTGPWHVLVRANQRSAAGPPAATRVG